MRLFTGPEPGKGTGGGDTQALKATDRAGGCPPGASGDHRLADPDQGATPPARLDAFATGFRAAFQVPDAQPSLAGLITTSAHQRWIEGFLVESAKTDSAQPAYD